MRFKFLTQMTLISLGSWGTLFGGSAFGFHLLDNGHPALAFFPFALSLAAAGWIINELSKKAETTP